MHLGPEFQRHLWGAASCPGGGRADGPPPSPEARTPGPLLGGASAVFGSGCSVPKTASGFQRFCEALSSPGAAEVWAAQPGRVWGWRPRVATALAARPGPSGAGAGSKLDSTPPSRCEGQRGLGRCRCWCPRPRAGSSGRAVQRQGWPRVRGAGRFSPLAGEPEGWRPPRWGCSPHFPDEDAEPREKGVPAGMLPSRTQAGAAPSARGRVTLERVGGWPAPAGARGAPSTPRALLSALLRGPAGAAVRVRSSGWWPRAAWGQQAGARDSADVSGSCHRRAGLSLPAPERGVRATFRATVWPAARPRATWTRGLPGGATGAGT